MFLETIVSVSGQYQEAFHRCYPHKTVELKPKKTGPGEWKTRVIINGDPGDILLSEEDMQYAIRLFNRGR